MTRPKPLAAVLIALTLAAGSIAAQQLPTFRSGTKTVPVYVTVTDKSGRLIPDLAKEDFQIFDNAKPADISLFVNDVQYIKVAVMLDMSGSMTLSYDLLKDAAEQFILRLLPEDKAVIGMFADVVKLNGPLTNDRDRLIKVLREIDFGNGTALWDGVDEGMTALSGLDGRRVVLVFTDGDDNVSKHGLGDVMKRAQNEDFMVYAIGLQSRIQNQVTKPDSGLRKIAVETGGGYFELTKTADLNPTFTKVAKELHSQYVLGFTPALLDGKMHTIEVRTKTPGLTVRARKSYIASPDK